MTPCCATCRHYRPTPNADAHSLPGVCQAHVPWPEAAMPYVRRHGYWPTRPEGGRGCKVWELAGEAGQQAGEAGRGVAEQARLGSARHGSAWLGMAGRGMAWHGWAGFTEEMCRREAR